jgi:hypothetical protein
MVYWCHASGRTVSRRPATWNSEQIEAAEQARWAEQQAEGSSSGRRRAAGRAVESTRPSMPGHTRDR